MQSVICWKSEESNAEHLGRRAGLTTSCELDGQICTSPFPKSSTIFVAHS